MKKFLFILILTFFAVSLGWRSLSEDIREQALTLLTIAKNRDREGAKAFLSDILVSESPRKEREVIIQRLKNQIVKIKEEQQKNASSRVVSAFDSNKNELAPLPVLIEGAGESIKELEKANKKETIGEIITEKISHIVFPPESACESKK